MTIHTSEYQYDITRVQQFVSDYKQLCQQHNLCFLSSDLAIDTLNEPENNELLTKAESFFIATLPDDSMLTRHPEII